jgi:hypothetical protein
VHTENTATLSRKWLTRPPSSRRFLAALCLTVSLLGGEIARAQPVVREGALLIVDLSRSRTLHTAVGQEILVRSLSFPLVPEHLNKSFAVHYDTDRLRLLSDRPLSGEGRIGRQYLFVVQAPGAAEIRIVLKDHGQMIHSDTLNLLAE